MTLQELTKKQAIEAGYTYFGFANKEWQTCLQLDDLTDDQYDKDLRLFDKESITPRITEKQIKETIADQMQSDWYDDSGDDTEDVFNAISSVDFSEIVKSINEAVSKIKCYRLTKIKLIKE